ncbi:hypothetical protein C8F04DRAFT_1239064 [Mycena alexandri]|uniref:Uncharacterized protein n=1 Tax=Mycena alexandri TaxID=1745969 RepID=A0AAD6SCU8_9AGAR|nr:hypothetical protein C8F04DRAFT_1239064 [Mycena alexandri]
MHTETSATFQRAKNTASQRSSQVKDMNPADVHIKKVKPRYLVRERIYSMVAGKEPLRLVPNGDLACYMADHPEIIQYTRARISVAGLENDCAPPYTDPSIDFGFNFNGHRKIDSFAFGCVFLESLTWTSDIIYQRIQGPTFDGERLSIDTVVFAPFKKIWRTVGMTSTRMVDSSLLLSMRRGTSLNEHIVE